MDATRNRPQDPHALNLSRVGVAIAAFSPVLVLMLIVLACELVSRIPA